MKKKKEDDFLLEKVVKTLLKFGSKCPGEFDLRWGNENGCKKDCQLSLKPMACWREYILR